MMNVARYKSCINPFSSTFIFLWTSNALLLLPEVASGCLRYYAEVVTLVQTHIRLFLRIVGIFSLVLFTENRKDIYVTVIVQCWAIVRL
jgi:hypothetical protein